MISTRHEVARKVDAVVRENLKADSTVAGADLFFFSSRRRHTRSPGDWSSDVCSSDLMIRHTRSPGDWSSDVCSSDPRLNSSHQAISYAVFCLEFRREIGRASWSG